MRLSPILLAASVAAWPTKFVERAVSYSIDFSFGVTVPTSLTSTSSNPLDLSVNGYQISVPHTAKNGTLVSWLANYKNGTAYNTQVTSIDPSAPRNITTSSSTTSLDGGNSFTNATALADDTNARVVTTSFSSGNAASAAASALNATAGTSTSSSGASNSTAVATANAAGDVAITTSANTDNALDSQSIINAQGAESATSCATESGAGASSEAEEINVVIIPIGQNANGTQVVVKSSAFAACSAGVDAPSQNGTASSGSQASLAGVESTVTCDGVTSTEQQDSTTFTVTITGTYTLGKGFSGAIEGQRVASSSSEC